MDQFEHLITRFLRDYASVARVNLGASLILIQGDEFLFTLTKPSTWTPIAGGQLKIEYSGVGGALKPHETSFEGLCREVREELGVSVDEFVQFPARSSVEHLVALKPTEPLDTGSHGTVLPYCVAEFPPHMCPPQERNSSSCLLLFIYVGIVIDSYPRKIVPRENIPAILRVNSSVLHDFLSGPHNVVMSAPPNGINFVLNPNADKPLPEAFTLSPKFTPQALRSLLPRFNELAMATHK